MSYTLMIICLISTSPFSSFSCLFLNEQQSVSTNNYKSCILIFFAMWVCHTINIKLKWHLENNKKKIIDCFSPFFTLLIFIRWWRMKLNAPVRPDFLYYSREELLLVHFMLNIILDITRGLLYTMMIISESRKSFIPLLFD